MAIAPTVLRLLPWPGSDHHHHHPSLTNVFSASAAGGPATFHGSISLSLHHRRPQRSSQATSRFSPVEENVDEEERSLPLNLSSESAAPWEEKLSASDMDDTPWTKKSPSRPQTFRPAPWQQGALLPSAPLEDGASGGFPSEDDGISVRDTGAESDKSAMLKIVEKLRLIQKGFRPPDGNAAGSRGGNVEPRGSVFKARGQDVEKPKGSVKNFSPPRVKSSVGADLKAATFLQTDMSASDLASDGKSSKFPWEQDEETETKKKLLLAASDKRGPRVPTLADLTLPREELIRLRLLGLQLDERLKIGKLGVTKNIAMFIKEQFRSSELVKARCEGPAAASIKKTALDLEEKTGGLAVLRTGKIIVMYRGSNYKLEKKSSVDGSHIELGSMSSQESHTKVQAETCLPGITAVDGLGSNISGLQEALVGSETCSDAVTTEAAAEAERILDDLGPRFEGWTGLLPCPIDADLLPQVIPNFRPPFRLMPYRVNPRMTNSELTNLRRLARPLAPHFILGRNRGHQGLAAAIVKLWEKSEIAKIAVKKRVQNTNNLIMAEELKQLTGGILLARDKFFITFYRGKDFVPQNVAAALVERESSVRDLQELEEKARDERNIPVKWTPYAKPSISVIREEAPAVKPTWVHTMDVKEQERLKKEVLKLQRNTLACELEKKLGIALKKKQRTEEELRKLNAFLNPIDRPIDVEAITAEERFMFQKLGLKMKAYLLIGRRGVFDGVVENMHLHWKHRELVKIVVKEVDNIEVKEIARTLEHESGGILVSVSPSKKGQAIIMYRGKNYQRPLELRPQNLLTKRKALKKSLELQRHESLSKNVKSLQEQILSIKMELRKLGEDETVAADELASNLVLDNGYSSQLQTTGSDSGEEDASNLDSCEELELIDVKQNGGLVSDEIMHSEILREQIKQLEKLVRSGPLYQAGPLSNSERLELRKESLLSGRAPQFFVGKHNGLEGLARGVRIYFLHHDLVQIVVKGRGPEMLIDDVIHQLEELTGGVFVSREANKIIMYRGWPKGFRYPFSENLGSITPELLSALEAEEIWEDGSIRDYRIKGQADESDNEAELEDNDESVYEDRYLSDGGSDHETDQMAVWEDIKEGSDEDTAWDDE